MLCTKPCQLVQQFINMKRILAILACFSGCVYAQPVEIARTDDGDVWYGYPKTLIVTHDKYAFLSELRNSHSTSHIFLAIDVKSCINGKGNLYGKVTPNATWQTVDIVDVTRQSSVSSVIASVLCSVGDERSHKILQKMT